MEISRNITNRNRTIKNDRKIEYIVIHYVGAVSTAKNNTIYFKDAYRGVSAHYFVDDNSIWQCVEEKDRAWHSGGALIYYNKARNDNSIGVEMCCFMNNGKLDISAKTIANTIELVKDIMKRYNIPIENVVRHYDVTHKKCPAPFVDDVSRWEDFKSRLIETSSYPTYTVKKGDSLWKIAEKCLGNGSKYPLIAELNNIEGNFIYVGQVLKIPSKNANTNTPKKSVEEIAKEVIKGKWGNGADRKKRLADAGYNYAEVQAKVNQLLKK